MEKNYSQKKSNSNSLEDEFEKSLLEKQIEDLRLENYKLKALIAQYDLEEEEGIKEVSDAEAICTVQIAKLNELSQSRALELEEIKMFEILNKQLILLTGGSENKRKVKPKQMSVADLMKIAGGNNGKVKN